MNNLPTILFVIAYACFVADVIVTRSIQSAGLAFLTLAVGLSTVL